jgi:EmrB/QacA subfamily drug resistance transporter
VNAYVLSLASLILIGGSLGDHYGRRRIFVVGVALFAAASLACALAPTAETLIAARALKGVGGALLVPNSLAILSAAFSRETRGGAIGAWSGFGALTGAGGPVFGGWIVDAFGWEWVFLINVPIAALTVLLAVLVVPESRGGEKGGLDWTGAGLAATGLGLFAYGLVRLADGGSAVAVSAILAGLAVFAGFVAWEARSTQPMAPLGLFRSRTFSGVNLVTAFLYAGLTGALFLVPFQLIEQEGYSAAQAGAAFLPLSIPLALLSGVVGGHVKRLGARWPLVVGGAVACAALASMALVAGTDASYFASWFWPFLGLGLGMTLVVAPLTTAGVQQRARPDERGGLGREQRGDPAPPS